MDEYESLCHTKVGVQIPRGIHPEVPTQDVVRAVAKRSGGGIRRLAAQKESRDRRGHLMSDHVHMMIAIPPKYAVSQVIGYIKGKSAIHLARVLWRAKAKLCGAAFLGAEDTFVVHGWAG